MDKNCIECKIYFFVRNNKKGIKRKYCSLKCYRINEKGKHWSKATEIKKGQRISIKTEFSSQTTLRENNINWKGDNVGYIALHAWVYRQLGEARNWDCVYCGSEDNAEWANVSREYKRELDDWIPLCRKCHFRYDKQHLRKRDWRGRFLVAK